MNALRTKAGRFLPPAVAVLALLVVPLFVESPYLLHMFILLFIAVATGESWNIIGGFGGQYSVGHAAYYGFGAYVTYILLQQRQWPPWVGVWVAVALSVGVALIIGSICFRLRGPYFVLASIAVAEIVRLIALNWDSMTQGAQGIVLSDIPPLVLFGKHLTDWNSKIPYYHLGLLLAAFCVFANWWVKNHRLGYYLEAIREDQDAAHSLGIPLARAKNEGLVISAALTALSGAFAALYIGFIEPQAVLGIDVSIQMVLICIIGGIGTVVGPVVGAVVLVVLSEALRANLFAQALFQMGIVSETSRLGAFLKENLAHAHVLIYGILVVVVILFMPDGIVGFVMARLRHRRPPPAAPAEPVVAGGAP